MGLAVSLTLVPLSGCAGTVASTPVARATSTQAAVAPSTDIAKRATVSPATVVNGPGSKVVPSGETPTLPPTGPINMGNESESEYQRVRDMLSCTECAEVEETLVQEGEKVVPVLIEIYRNEPPEQDALREGIVFILGQIGGPLAVEALIDALDDPVGHGQFYAAEALGGLGDLRAVEPLIRTLEFGEWGPNRDLLTEALGRLGDPRALPILKRIAQDDPDDRIRRAAEAAIAQIEK